MWRAKTDKQNNRRLSGALLCAALLHIALFAAIELFSNFTSTSSQSNRSTVTRVQLSLPQESKKAAAPISAKSVSENRAQPAEQTRENTSRAEPAKAEAEQKAPVSPVKTVKSPRDTVVENASAAKPQVKLPVPTSEEVPTRDDKHSFSPQAKSKNAAKSEPPTAEIPFSPQTAEGLTQFSNRAFARQRSANQSKNEHQEFTVYLQQLIEENRRYPRAARRRNIEGAVEFSVNISKGGTLAGLSLASSSGSRILDKAAEDLLQRVFPVDYPLQESVRTTVRIIYKLTEV